MTYLAALALVKGAATIDSAVLFFDLVVVKLAMLGDEVVLAMLEAVDFSPADSHP